MWKCVHMYEEAKATNYAKLIQTPNAPKDCAYEDLGLWDSVAYYIRVSVSGREDRCEQYYKSIIIDPLLSISLVEALSRTISALVFSQLGYIGDKLGLFIEGITIKYIPFWLQPITIISMTVLIIVVVLVACGQGPRNRGGHRPPQFLKRGG